MKDIDPFDNIIQQVRDRQRLRLQEPDSQRETGTSQLENAAFKSSYQMDFKEKQEGRYCSSNAGLNTIFESEERRRQLEGGETNSVKAKLRNKAL